MARGAPLSEQLVVLDASALLALLFREEGAEIVRPLVQRAAMSTANWGEVCQRVLERGSSLGEVREASVEAGLKLEPLRAADAEQAARLRPATRQLGLSLADRCCLALATRLDRTILTADRAWAGLDVGVEVRLIRGEASTS